MLGSPEINVLILFDEKYKNPEFDRFSVSDWLFKMLHVHLRSAWMINVDVKIWTDLVINFFFLGGGGCLFK